MIILTEPPSIVTTHAPATSYPPAADTAPAGRINRRDLEKAYRLYSDAENRGVELAEAGRDELATPWLKEGDRLWAELEALKARYKVQTELDAAEIAARRVENEAMWPEVQELIKAAELRDRYTAAKSNAQATADKIRAATSGNFRGGHGTASPTEKKQQAQATAKLDTARRELVEHIRTKYATAAATARMVSGTRPELVERINKAAELVNNRALRQNAPGQILVTGSPDPKGRTAAPVYRVELSPAPSCTCPDFAHRAPETSRAKVCKHILAAKIAQELEEVK